MPQRLHTVRSIPLDLVEAIRRAYLRRGVYIKPAAPDAAGKSPAETARHETAAGQSEEKDDNKNNHDEGKTPPELTGSQEPQEAHEKLIDVTEKAQDLLFQANTRAPFSFFQDTIILDREKLTVVKRNFIRSAQITSVPLSSVSAAEADVGPVFGSAHISSKYFVQNKYSIEKLTRKDTMDLVHLLQGFIIAHEKGIDLTDIQKDDLLILLKDLGTGVTE